MSLQLRRWVVLLLLHVIGFVLVFASGCCVTPDCHPGPWNVDRYVLPRFKPSDVVNNLVVAYKRRDIDEYSKLLAEDFQFYFDPSSRPEGVSEFWNRQQDSTATAHLFSALEVVDIRITLTYEKADKPDNEVHHVGWRKIQVTDTFLEVDKVTADGADVLTLRVNGDEQQFFFRRGRSPADTLASSPTAKEWFLVEWRDLGHPAAPTDVAEK